EMSDAEFVTRFRAGGAPGALRKNDELTALADFLVGARRHVDQRLGAGTAIDRDHTALPHAPAEDWNPHQFALDDEGEVVEQAQQRERLPGGLVLGCDDQRPLRQVLQATKLDLGAANDAQEPNAHASPEFGHLENG